MDKRGKMKIVLLNLPLPDFYDKYQKVNHSLFGEYMKILVQKNDLKNIDIVLLSADITDNYNNLAIIDELRKISPDAVGFSSYLWNVKRNEAIAKDLKKSGIITFTGGPEVQSDNLGLLNDDNFDIFFEGEGEEAFLSFLKSLNEEKSFDMLIDKKSYKSDISVDINDFIEEYSDKTLEFKSGGLCYIETERGCPFSCSFCVYGKMRKRIGKLDFDKFKKVFLNFIEKGARDFYFLSPTLNYSKEDFRKKLEFISSIKKDENIDINIFGELKAELIDEEDMRLLKSAGFTSIEFGVQSFSEDVLLLSKVKEKKIDYKEFTYKLLEYGITPIIDFIVGLPGDTYENLVKTVEALSEDKILDYCSFYHLQILPGADIKNDFIENGFEFSPYPPYFATKTDSMTLKDIKNVYLYLETEKNFSYRDEYFSESKETFFIVKGIRDFEELNKSKFYQTNSFILKDNFEEKTILNFFDNYFSENQEIFHICYLYSDDKISEFFLRELNIIFNRYRNYYDDYHESINYFNDESFSKKFKILCKFGVEKKYYEFLADNYSFDFIFFPSEERIFKAKVKELEYLYENEDIESYVFLENKAEYDFLKVFPKNFYPNRQTL